LSTGSAGCDIDHVSRQWPRNRRRIVFNLRRWPVLLALPLLCAAQPDSLEVGAIDFFGASGMDLASIRAALPIGPGATISKANAASMKTGVDAAVTRVAGAPPTDVSIVCCNPGGHILIYIGLPGKNVRTISHLPPPSGSSCLPSAAVRLYERDMNALQKAVQAGDTAEDTSGGYALSHYPEYRDAQLALRKYAVAHGSLLRSALRGCASAQNRAAAAQLLGYAVRSRAQVDALVRAANDSDASVRNNAVRALGVLASFRSRKTAQMIPAGPFIAMLNSGTWEDRNKAGLLLSALITQKRSNMLAAVRRDAMDSLVEMARWQNRGHADLYRVLLGRVAGLDAARLNELISAGDVEAIIDAARRH
jgi:HEAT repeat protein